MKSINFDITIPSTRNHFLAKKMGKETLMLLDPGNHQNLYRLEGYLAKFYSSLDNERTLKSYVSDLKLSHGMSDSEACATVLNALSELLDMKLIKIRKEAL